MVLAVLHIHGSNGREPTKVKKVFGFVGDGGVAGFEESVADSVAKEEAFSVNGLQRDRHMGGKDIKNDAGWDRGDMGENRSDSGAEGYFLGEGIGVKVGEGRKGDSGGGGVRTKGNRSRGRRVSSRGDGGRGKLDHGGKVGSNKRDRAGGGFWCNRYRSHVTKDGSVVRLCV